MKPTQNDPPPSAWNGSQLFSSASVEWGTPEEFFDRLNDEFVFQLDVCAGEPIAWSWSACCLPAPTPSGGVTGSGGPMRSDLSLVVSSSSETMVTPGQPPRGALSLCLRLGRTDHRESL